MNNRPLFGAVMCFALGEVLYICAGRGNEISTALAVLVCVGVIISKIKSSVCAWKRWLYLAFFLLGFWRIWHAQECYMGDVLFGPGEYVEIVDEYEGYDVCYRGHEDYGMVEDGIGDEATVGDESSDILFRQQVSIKGVGVIDNVTQSNNGYNITVKMMASTIPEAVIYQDFKLIIYSVENEMFIGQQVLLEGVINDFVKTGNPGEFNRKNYYKARGVVGFGGGSSVELTEYVEDYGDLYSENYMEYVGGYENVSGVDGDERMDWAESYGGEGLAEECELSTMEVCLYSLKRGVYKLRLRLAAVLYELCDEEDASLYAGLLLGDKSEIPDDAMLLYRLSGIAHIFAISGLHIGIVGGLLYKLLRKLGLRFLPAAVLAMWVTFMYGLMTGFSFSTIRAIVMLGLSLGGEVLGRKYDMLTGMALALGVLLMVQPFALLDGGLILSFGAVAGVVVSKYLMGILDMNKSFVKYKKKGKRWVYGIVSALVFSIGISLVTTPLIAYMYFQIPLYAALLNMVVVPMVTFTVYSGFFGVLVGLCNPSMGKLIIAPGVLSLKLYQGMCRLFQKLPGAVINTGRISVWEIILYYVVVAVFLVCVNPEIISWVRRIIHKKTMKWIPYMRLRAITWVVMASVIVMGVVSVVFIRAVDEREEIIFLDVGQGDGTLIRTDKGVNIAIDVGSASNESLGEYVAYPAILTELDGHIDYWFLSHLDKDHISGLEYLLSMPLDMGITIDNIVVSDSLEDEEEQELLMLAYEKGINIIYMRQGDYITDGSFVITALHPGSDFEGNDKNEQSLVLEYQSKGIKALFTGDIGEEGILSMLEEESLLGNYDILKVPHHGSRYSYSKEFLEKVNPKIAVISCGARNFYGHPHTEMLEGLEACNIRVYRTDYIGGVRVIIN